MTPPANFLRHTPGRPFRQVLLALAAVGSLLLPGPAIGAEGDSARELSPPEFRQVPPLPAVRQAAGAAGFQLEGFAAPGREKLKPGDAATLLVTLTDGGKSKQWIIELEADAPTQAETKQAPESMQFHSSTGHHFLLGGGRAALKLRVTGPLEAKDAGTRKATAPPVEQRRILVSPDYLGLGLHRMPAYMMRLEAARKANPATKLVEFKIAQKPYPADVVAAARREWEQADPALKASPAEEVGFIGTVLAVQEFFLTANNTPGLQEVLRRVIDIPWWAIISRGGGMDVGFDVLPALRELSPAPWGLPARDPIYALPFRLSINDKPCLLVQLAVTRPRPPLLVSAGAIGFAAGPLNGKGPVLTFQVIATRTRAAKK